MTPEFWAERWRLGQIGFHRSSVDESLQRFWHRLEVERTAQVFVPFCGKSLDLVWLRGQGHDVVGVELSDAALQAFCLENGIAARRRSTPPFERYEAPGMLLLGGDFFALDGGALRGIRAVYDRASLIALPPDSRARYVAHLDQVLRSGTCTLLITLEYDQAELAGPPFSVPRAEVEQLFGRRHVIRELDRRDILPAEPRMRARGVTSLHEVAYHLTRL